RRPEFIDYFDHHRQQLPLTDGDAIFFNPAVFHAAGSNVTATVRRMANLLQISSAMGRALEYVNRRAMCVALYPAIRRAITSGMGTADIERVIAASAEGYPFPTDLDRDQPVGGLVPPSQADLVRQAVREGWDAPHLSTALADHAAVRGA
ncbi:MAG: phytanoyl-CoA dioxygenase family protein, partial [Actinomycetota bacterium]